MQLDQFSPTERKIFNILADGRPHSAQEIHGCLPDELGPLKNISSHLTSIRKILRPRGHDISHQRSNGTTYYFLVRMLGAPYRDAPLPEPDNGRA